MLAVRTATPTDTEDCLALVRGLPEFFTEDVPEKIPAELANHPAWVVTNSGELLGFVIVDHRSARAAEIRWMAVAAAARGRGVGTRLLDQVMGELAEDGIRLVTVKTLDASAGYAPYLATRAFWEQRGFVHVDTIDPFPEWPPGNPAAIYVAALATTR